MTYQAVGATAGPDEVPGYRHDRWDVDLGPDDGARFERSVKAVREWAPQRGAGMRIFPDQPVAPGLTFMLAVPLPVGFAVAGARVVYVIDEPDCAGFAYGTLPEHPEEGEEAFLIRRHDGRVRFEVTAFSRPRHPLARLGAPVARLLQVRATNAYLRAMRAASA